MSKFEIRKRICGSLNEWEYWAVFKNNEMISPWLNTEARAHKFIEQYEKGIPVEQIEYYVPIDFVNKEYRSYSFDFDKEEKLLSDKELKVAKGE